jgi:hypothetical protein
VDVKFVLLVVDDRFALLRVGVEKMSVVLKGGSVMVKVAVDDSDTSSLELDGSNKLEEGKGVGVDVKIGSEDSLGDGSGIGFLLLSEGSGTSNELGEGSGVGVVENIGDDVSLGEGSRTGSLLLSDGSGTSNELEDDGSGVGQITGVEDSLEDGTGTGLLLLGDGSGIDSLLLSDGSGTSNELDEDSRVGVGETTGVEISNISELEDVTSGTSDDELDSGTTIVEVTVSTVVFAVGGPLYPPEDFGGSVVLNEIVIGTMIEEELLKYVGMTGVRVAEVEFTPVGPVSVEGAVDGGTLVPVPVPQVERDVLVLLP